MSSNVSESSSRPPRQGPDSEDFLPVLIIPGFMSSGLEVAESPVSRSWVGKRVWINLTSLGFQSMHRGSALLLNEEKRESGDKAAYSEETHQEYEKQLECKNRWLQHISLSDDMMTERPGTKVRAIRGLAGVDYLTPGALTNHLSYVFGPLINALKSRGYTDDNLDAAPYDWRLPPNVLEDRDGYFSNTMKQVEKMYQRNGNAPVVILCHSLGCKTGHYFLNFAKDHPKGGIKWLEKYIHTYLPVGGPHLGAPKSVRALVDGDKMGLDAFLNDEEGLILGRSLGSGPWLVPRMLPTEGHVSPNVFLRKEGALEVTVPPIDCTSLLRERRNDPPKLRLSVIFGNDVLMTSFQSPSADGRGKLIYSFPGIFTFATDHAISKGGRMEDAIQIVLQEPGVEAAAKKGQKEKDLYSSPLCCPLRCAVGILCCPIKYVLCLPCTLIGCVACTTLQVTKEVALAGGNAIASAMGAGTNVALSQALHLSNALAKGHHTRVNLHMLHVRDKSPKLFRTQRTALAKVHLKWIPPPQHPSENQRRKAPVASVPKNAPKFRHFKKKHIQYEPSDGYELFRNEGLGRALDMIEACYENDTLGPRTRSAEDPPPVRRVFAIYGVNLPTETGAIYRRRPIWQQEHRIEKLHTLDTSARAAKEAAAAKDDMSTKYKIKGGIVLETKETPQILARPYSHSDKAKQKVIHRSGDGTVPYWSMQHCRTWQGPCDVHVEEIEGAEHREILADARFHKVLLSYLTKGAGEA